MQSNIQEIPSFMLIKNNKIKEDRSEEYYQT